MIDFQKISSADNSKIKALGKLALKKYRREENLFAVENFVIIFDALASGFDFESLFLTQEFIDKHGQQVDFLREKSASQNFYLVDEKLNRSYSELDTPSGITAVYKITPKEIDDSSVLYLNGISDPGNLGAIMRNCLAFDFHNLVLDKTCADPYASKTVNAAKDAIFKLNIIEDGDASWLLANRLPLYSSSSHNGVCLSDFKPSPKFCLVLGSESHGVDKTINDKADVCVKIEMSDKIESLNVAAASAILLYELGKKRKN